MSRETQERLETIAYKMMKGIVEEDDIRDKINEIFLCTGHIFGIIDCDNDGNYILELIK